MYRYASIQLQSLCMYILLVSIVDCNSSTCAEAGERGERGDSLCIGMPAYSYNHYVCTYCLCL